MKLRGARTNIDERDRGRQVDHFPGIPSAASEVGCVVTMDARYCQDTLVVVVVSELSFCVPAPTSCMVGGSAEGKEGIGVWLKEKSTDRVAKVRKGPGEDRAADQDGGRAGADQAGAAAARGQRHRRQVLCRGEPAPLSIYLCSALAARVLRCAWVY